MTKLSLSVLIILFIGINAHAGKPTALNKEIQTVEKAYQKTNDLSATFVQTTNVALLDKTVTKKGTFRFKKGGRFRIEYEGRDGKHYVSDGTTLWVFIPGDAASLQTFAVDDRNVPREVLSFLDGFGRLRKEFQVSASVAFPEAKSDEPALHLKPKKSSPHFESLDALFRADGLLVELIIHNSSGNVSRYRFSDIRTNQSLPDRLFSLSKGKATPDTIPE